MSNREILEKIQELKPTSISDILEVLERLGVAQIAEADFHPTARGQAVVIIKDLSQHEYYFGLSAYGFVEIVRDGSVFGEIVYAPIE